MAGQATANESSAAQGALTLHGHSVEGVNRCVHCGLCLAYCPTFSLLGTEMDSPRGRIFLIKSLAEGRIGLGDSTVRHLDLCLGCRACETVCPAGVPYGELIEAARAEVERQRPGGLARRLFRWLNFGVLLRYPAMLSLAAIGLRFYQASGLRTVARRTGLVKLLPGPLPAWEPLLPDLPPARDRAPLPEVTPAAAPRRGRWASSPAVSSAWPSAPTTEPPRASSRPTAPRWSRRAVRVAAGRSTPTAASTPPRWTSRGAPSRHSRRPASTTLW